MQANLTSQVYQFNQFRRQAKSKYTGRLWYRSPQDKEPQTAFGCRQNSQRSGFLTCCDYLCVKAHLVTPGDVADFGKLALDKSEFELDRLGSRLLG